ncbi:hypothetical protein [Streptomyces sp. NPDC048637]|uniref:hypothetical protein n=1 Tax=Streptomyces sp. NPDC048637 TaxID=3155636 RepID=UPI0034197C13
MLELANVGAQFGVDPLDLFRGPVGIGVQHVPEAGRRDAGLGEGDDPGQVDECMGESAPATDASERRVEGRLS